VREKIYKNEGAVKEEVKKILKLTDRCWWFMPSSNGFGRPGIPDFMGCVGGNLFGVETKFCKGVLTAHQVREIAAIELCDGRCWVVNERNIEEWKVEFARWSAICC